LECPGITFACSSNFGDNFGGNWQNGTKLFLDPFSQDPNSNSKSTSSSSSSKNTLASHYKITQVRIKVFGNFNCRGSWEQLSTSFNITLQKKLVHTWNFQDSVVCSCPVCNLDILEYNTPEISDGWETYKYGDKNEVQVTVVNNYVCIHHIQLFLTFSKMDSDQNSDFFIEFQQYIIIAAIVVCSVLVIALSFISIRIYQKSKSKYTLLSSGSQQSNRLFTISGKEIQLGNRIGKGSYGEVYHAKWRGIDVAVKKLPFHLLENKEFRKDFNQEAMIMASLRHPNVIQFLGSCMIENDICILTEYMARGSLHRLLHEETFPIDFSLIKKFAKDAASGIFYLHKSTPAILHRDLKSHNLLVDETFKVKISDFGLSKIVEKMNSTMTSCGTAAWAAPEILKNNRYTEKADVYSFGVCLWEFWTRRDPYEGMQTFQIIFNVGTANMRPLIPEDCPTDYAQLMMDCWQTDPSARPSFEQILGRLNFVL